MEPNRLAEMVVGAIDEIAIDSTDYPLFEYFKRVGQTAKTVLVNGRYRDHTVGGLTGPDGKMTQVDRGRTYEIKAEPSYHRPADGMDASEMSLYAAWDELVRTKADMDPGLNARVQGKVNEISGNLFQDSNDTNHHVLAQAMQNTGTYKVDGLTQAITYGLPTIAAPSIKWDTANAATAKPIYDIRKALKAFRNSAGVDATHVFYNPDLIVDNLLLIEDYIAYIKAVPRLAEAMAGNAPQDWWATANGSFIDPLWGLEWVPISGTHTVNGASASRWDVKSLTFANLTGAGEYPLEHRQVLDAYTPNVGPSVESWEEKDPKGLIVRRADNVCALFKTRDRVQTWQVLS